MTDSDSFYYQSIEKESLRQGEIFTNVLQLIPIPGTSCDSPQVVPAIHDFAILLSQDCDLATDFLMRQFISDPTIADDKKKKYERKLLKNALFCEVIVGAESISALGDGVPKDLLKKNDDFRYHILQEIPADKDGEGEGIPPVIISFKQYFTVPMDDLLARISDNQTRRRTCMNSPYFEHVSSRFSYYLGRIGLPTNHAF